MGSGVGVLSSEDFRMNAKVQIGMLRAIVNLRATCSCYFTT
jgi:hypothetical protein